MIKAEIALELVKFSMNQTTEEKRNLPIESYSKYLLQVKEAENKLNGSVANKYF
jgi:hypothetical protein